jgi:hypothetical protein
VDLQACQDTGAEIKFPFRAKHPLAVSDRPAPSLVAVVCELPDNQQITPSQELYRYVRNREAKVTKLFSLL